MTHYRYTCNIKYFKYFLGPALLGIFGLLAAIQFDFICGKFIFGRDKYKEKGSVEDNTQTEVKTA